MRLDAKDLATILDYGPATAPDFPDDCALCRQPFDIASAVLTGLGGGFLEIEVKETGAKGDYWLCQQCIRRLGIPEEEEQDLRIHGSYAVCEGDKS